MSGGQKVSTQGTSSNTINPQSMAMLQGNYNTAQQNAGTLTSGYSGQLTAPLNPTQVQAMGVLGNVAQNPAYQGNIAAATSAAQGILGSPANPTITPQTVNAQTVAGTDLSPYMNPYQNDVINSTMGQYNLMNQQQLNNTNQGSTAAGAFGGSRSGVADALTNQNDTTAEAPVLAGLNASNFTNAQNMAATDAATKNAMGQYNATNNLNAQQNTYANTLANQNMGLTAANDVANLSAANLNAQTAQGGILSAVGQQQQNQQQQNQQQATLSNAYQAWLQGKQLTMDQQQMLNQALGLIPVQSTTNQSGTSSTTTNPGLAGILGAVGSAAQGLGSAPAGGTSALGSLSSLFSGSGGAAGAAGDRMSFMSDILPMIAAA
jgi:hypothetical protein